MASSRSQLLCVCSLVIAASSPAPPPAPAVFDCATRHLALEYAISIQPFRGKSDFDMLASVLDESGGLPGGITQCDNVTYDGPDKEFTPTFPVPTRGHVYYIDYANGKDCQSCGSLAKPFQSVAHALQTYTLSGATEGALVLRAGVHYLGQRPIMLNASHSKLVIQNYNGERAWISGATLLGQEAWKQTAPGSKIWTMQVPAAVTEITGLRIGSERAVRARYPNGCTSTSAPLPSGYVCGGSMKGSRVVDPNDGFGSNLINEKGWIRPEAPTMNSTKTIEPSTPFRSSGLSFQKFMLGVGGSCSQFDPPAGYWCGNDCMGGAPKPPGCIPRWPQGFSYDQSILPNAPPGGYKNAERMVVQAWHPGHWASWMFSTSTMNDSHVMFGRGGFQGARGGYAGNRLADAFFIENVLEELDADNEFYFDESAKTLYYHSSAAPIGVVEALGVQKTLISIEGTQEKPVKGVSLLGLGLRDAALSYLDAHSMPSGGDWGLGRIAAVFIKGTEDVMVDSCTFEKLDGSAVLLNKYNRYTTIQNNNFHEIGDNMIGLLGETEGVPEAYGMGWDGMKGDQPRHTRILKNFAYRCGLFEKQSSFYFQAKSAQNVIKDNIFFHGPRAGMNFNDGFGGGSLVQGNLMFNTVMESGDHGPFNSWDRQVYLTDVKDGSPSVDKAYDEISQNFFIGNWYGQEAIDNDDGSCYYNTHHNFFVYAATGMKNDFNGHDNHHHHNVYAFIGEGMGVCGNLPGHEDKFYSNKIIQTSDGAYAQYDCSCNSTSCPEIRDNAVFTPDGTMADVCGESLPERQKKGTDIGTAVRKHPSDMEIIAWGREVLDMPL